MYTKSTHIDPSIHPPISSFVSFSLSHFLSHPHISFPFTVNVSSYWMKLKLWTILRWSCSEISLKYCDISIDTKWNKNLYKKKGNFIVVSCLAYSFSVAAFNVCASAMLLFNCAKCILIKYNLKCWVEKRGKSIYI